MLSPKKIRVVLVEDHAVFREQLAELINCEPDMLVTGQADNASDALKIIEKDGADILIVDIALKGRTGLDLIKDLKARHIDAPVLVLSMHDELLYAERVLRAGARGYIAKHETSKEVMSAIRQVLSGHVYLGSRMASRVLDSMAGASKPAGGVSDLTDRELEIFALIGEGQPTRSICARLRIGVSTVDTYRARIKSKLNLENGSQLTHEAIRWVREGRQAGS